MLPIAGVFGAVGAAGREQRHPSLHHSRQRCFWHHRWPGHHHHVCLGWNAEPREWRLLRWSQVQQKGQQINWCHRTERSYWRRSQTSHFQWETEGHWAFQHSYFNKQNLLWSPLVSRPPGRASWRQPKPWWRTPSCWLLEPHPARRNWPRLPTPRPKPSPSWQRWSNWEPPAWVLKAQRHRWLKNKTSLTRHRLSQLRPSFSLFAQLLIFNSAALKFKLPL